MAVHSAALGAEGMPQVGLPVSALQRQVPAVVGSRAQQLVLQTTGQGASQGRCAGKCSQAWMWSSCCQAEGQLAPACRWAADVAIHAL